MSGKSELKIFDDHPPQKVVECGYFEDIHPRTSIDDGASVIEFFIPSSNVDYLDLNDTLLSLRIKIVKNDGKHLVKEDKKPVPENFFMYSLFSDVTVALNDVQIDGGSAVFPFKAAIESLLNFNKDTQNAMLYSLGYTEVTETRQAWVGNSKDIELVGPLRVDFFNHPKYLIPNVSVRISLTRHSSDFALRRADDDNASENGTWKILITKALLYVRRVKVHPAVLKAHSIGLEKRNAIYPYIRTKTVSFTIPKGSSSYFKDNLFSSNLLPKVVIIAFVEGEGFSGSVKAKAIHFAHNNVARVELLRDGQSLPYRRGYTCDFNNNNYTDAYVRSIIQNMNVMNTNNHCGIHLGDWKANHCLFVFNLTPDFDLKECQAPRDSNLRLDLTFHTSLPGAINVIAYAAYDGSIQITKNHEIIRDVYT